MEEGRKEGGYSIFAGVEANIYFVFRFLLYNRLFFMRGTVPPRYFIVLIDIPKLHSQNFCKTCYIIKDYNPSVYTNFL